MSAAAIERFYNQVYDTALLCWNNRNDPSHNACVAAQEMFARNAENIGILMMMVLKKNHMLFVLGKKSGVVRMITAIPKNAHVRNNFNNTITVSGTLDNEEKWRWNELINHQGLLILSPDRRRSNDIHDPFNGGFSGRIVGAAGSERVFIKEEFVSINSMDTYTLCETVIHLSTIYQMFLWVARDVIFHPIVCLYMVLHEVEHRKRYLNTLFDDLNDTSEETQDIFALFYIFCVHGHLERTAKTNFLSFSIVATEQLFGTFDLLICHGIIETAVHDAVQVHRYFWVEHLLLWAQKEADDQLSLVSDVLIRYPKIRDTFITSIFRREYCKKKGEYYRLKLDVMDIGKLARLARPTLYDRIPQCSPDIEFVGGFALPYYTEESDNRTDSKLMNQIKEYCVQVYEFVKLHHPDVCTNGKLILLTTPAITTYKE